MSIVLISFLLLGTMLLFFISQYWQNDKNELLRRNAESISALTQKSLVEDADTGTYYISNRYVLQGFLSTFSDSSNADIFITDVQGKTLLCSEGGNCIHTQQSIPDKIMKDVLNNGFVSTSNLGGIYPYSHFTVGLPVTSESGVQVGAVFTSTDALYLTSFRNDVLKMFLFAAIAALTISFFAVGLFSYKMVRPLREMAEAARCFGSGDFSRRVPVTSDDEIGELAVAFNNMAASLSSSEGTRRSFIANVSHELKTPMTTIAGFIDGILDGTIPPDKQNYYLKIVSDEVKRLSRLVKTMLDLSRIDNGELRMNKTCFELRDIILSVMITFEDSIEKKEVEIRGLEDAPAIFVDGDPDMIHQVVYNLVENAVKFVNPQGYIDVRVLNKGTKAVVKIRNSGQGISADEIPLIFDKFYKTDKSRSMDKNGMGLGLYIVRTIIKLHGGDITVSSVEGEYCEFEFWLPKQPEEQPPLLKE